MTYCIHERLEEIAQEAQAKRETYAKHQQQTQELFCDGEAARHRTPEEVRLWLAENYLEALNMKDAYFLDMARTAMKDQEAWEKAKRKHQYYSGVEFTLRSVINVMRGNLNWAGGVQ